MSAARSTRKVELTDVKTIRSVVHLCRDDLFRPTRRERDFGGRVVLDMKGS
jgi:hypothetical protein